MFAGHDFDEYRRLGPDDETAQKAIWAGEAASFVTRIESAADAVHDLVTDAANVLRTRPATVIHDP
jgi:hypothetical protein